MEASKCRGGAGGGRLPLSLNSSLSVSHITFNLTPRPHTFPNSYIPHLSPHLLQARAEALKAATLAAMNTLGRAMRQHLVVQVRGVGARETKRTLPLHERLRHNIKAAVSALGLCANTLWSR